MSAGTPPGWYPETGVPGSLRYWDGQQWTDQRRSAGGGATAPAQAPAQAAPFHPVAPSAQPSSTSSGGSSGGTSGKGSGAGPGGGFAQPLPDVWSGTVPPDGAASRRPARRSSNARSRLVMVLAAILVVGWTMGALALGVWTGSRQRATPLPPPAYVVVTIEEIALPDVVDAPEADQLRLPNVLGLTQTEALTVFGDAGIDLATVTLTPTGTAGDAGVVVAQNPIPGTIDPTGIQLDVSEPVEVPAVIGRTLDDARNELEQLGTVVRIVRLYSAGTAPNTVLSIDPASGALPDEVSLTVAAQPASVDLALLEPVERESCSWSAQELQVNGDPVSVAVSCSMSSVPAQGTPALQTVEYDLSRDADSLAFVAGFTDDSDPAAVAIVDVYVDGTLVASERFGFGAPVPIQVSVANGLRLRVQFRSDVPSGAQGSFSLGQAVIADAQLTGAADGIDALAQL